MKSSIIVGGAVLLVVAAVGLGRVHPFGDPRTVPVAGRSSLLQHANLPPPAKEVLVAKCADCHSNETHWPVYARIAPGSWLIERDIIEARKEMNLSVWDELSSEKQQELEGKIVHETKGGDMPPQQYLIAHWGARLSSGDLQNLAILTKGGDITAASPAGAGDAARGKQVFDKRCTGCHSVDANGEGPKLGGVYGRKAGTVSGFNYSAALKNSGIVWNDATLEHWLSDPDLAVPNNNMDFHVANPQERADLVAYLRR